MSRKQPKHHKKSSHPHPNQQDGQQQTGDDMDVRGSIEMSRSPNLEKQHQAERSEDAARENKRYRLEKVSLAAVIIYAFLTLLMYFATKRSADAARDAADAAKASADWTGHQARDFFNDQRPRVWAKIPDRIRIEVGKPIKPDIEIFNYGKTPGIARARIRFEAAPGVIEKFRDTLRNHPDDFSIPEQLGTLKFLINPSTGKRFPIETPELTLSKKDIRKLTAGTIDVAIYGRIFYADLDNSALGERNREYVSSFCFYIMRDGTTISACPNTYNPTTKYGAYTNWAN